MDRETLDSFDKETLIRLVLSQAEAILRLTAQLDALRAENAELRAKLGLPPKTPQNSSTPPSQGRKASGEEKQDRERNASRTLARIGRCIQTRHRGAISRRAPASIAEPMYRTSGSSSAKLMTISKFLRSLRT